VDVRQHKKKRDNLRPFSPFLLELKIASVDFYQETLNTLLQLILAFLRQPTWAMMERKNGLRSDNKNTQNEIINLCTEQIIAFWALTFHAF